MTKKERKRKQQSKWNRSYRSRNLAKIREKNRRWIRENPRKAARATKRWRLANPETLRLSTVVSNANKNAKRLGRPGIITLKQFRALLKKFGNVCVCCGRSGKLGVDHVKPLSKRGNNVVSNIQPMLPSCNRRKRNKYIDYRPQALARFKNKLKTQKDKHKSWLQK